MFTRQGHYALDDELVSAYPPADYTIDRLGKLVNLLFVLSIAAVLLHRFHME
jgi:hypothetical protein